MQESDPQFKSAVDAFRMIRKGLATPSQNIILSGEPHLDIMTLLMISARMASRIKHLEGTVKTINEKLHKIENKGQSA